MRYCFTVFCLFLLLPLNSSAEVSRQYDVVYRDYLGSHVVKGSKSSRNTFLFNPGAKKVIRLATLDWPPYIDKNMCKQGWVMQSTIALLHHLGYGAVVTFYPWARAVNVVESGKGDILFPEYHIGPEAPSDVYNGTRRLDHLIMSDSFGWGPIAFLKRKDDDIVNSVNLKSIVNEQIGVVRGYQNTPEFDRMMDIGSFKIIEALNDFHNVKLLLNHRVNLIVGDPLVIEADIRRADFPDKEKKAMLEQIEVVEPIMQMNALFFAISKKSQFAKVLPMEINQGIATFKKQGLFSEIQYRVGKHCNDTVKKP